MLHIHSDEEYKKLITENGKIIVKFGASWCRPCKQIAPYFEELSVECKHTVFVSLDVEECEKIGDILKVRALPTFVVLENGKEIARVVGADRQKLKTIVDSHCL